MFHFKNVLVSVLICCAFLRAGITQEIRVERNDVVSVASGWHPWYEMHVDPDNASNIILCGTRSDAKNDAFYGFVYFSADGGKSWHIAMEDKNTAFVSEESCAYGVHGIAYFIASASKVIDGEFHHELGTTRIYVSHDRGESWKMAIATGWTDFSTSIIDATPGPGQNRLYVFFNNLETFYSSIEKRDAAETEKRNSSGTRIGMISFSDGDSAVAGPFTSSEMSQEQYRGSLPFDPFVLNNGSLLTFFSAKRRTEQNASELMVATVRTNADRSGLDAPVKVVDSLDNPETDANVSCGGYFLTGSAAAYYRQREKLYFAYSDIREKKCHLFLTASTDGGKSWPKAQQVRSPDETTGHTYFNLSIAVNNNGVLGLMWQDQFPSDCWQFATSTDDGKSLSHPRRLGACDKEAMKPSGLTTAYLWTGMFQVDPNNSASAARINLRNTRDSVWRNQDAVTTTPDRRFHVVWGDAGNGNGEIRTAAIVVTPAKELITDGTAGLIDETARVSILYGGSQFYDPKTKTLTLDVTVRNNGEKALKTPLKLAVPNLYKDYGYAGIANADNKVSGAGAVWDISSTIPSDTLAPGAITRPFPLKFNYLPNPDVPRMSDDILGLEVRLYAGK